MIPLSLRPEPAGPRRTVNQSRCLSIRARPAELDRLEHPSDEAERPARLTFGIGDVLERLDGDVAVVAAPDQARDHVGEGVRALARRAHVAVVEVDMAHQPRRQPLIEQLGQNLEAFSEFLLK